MPAERAVTAAEPFRCSPTDPQNGASVEAAPFLAAPVFCADGEWFTWRDVTSDPDAAAWWEQTRCEAATGLALGARPHGTEHLRESVDRAAVAFRYEHGLISAEEAEQWLTRRGLSVAEWLDSLTRQILLGDDHIAPVISSIEPAVVERAAWVDAVCTGDALARAQALAERMAGALAAGERIDRGDNELPQTIRRGMGNFKQRIVTRQSIEREIANRRLDWVRIDGLAADFASRSQAFEAIMCIVEDETCIEIVARLAGAPTAAITFFAGDLLADDRTAAVSAIAGELLGPIGAGARHRVVRVDRKTLPSPDDSAVRERASQSIVENALRRESRARIIWLTD